MREAERQEIEAAVPGLRLDHYGNGCPWQADGRYLGRPFYARFRHNQASMTVYADDGETELLSSVLYPYFDPDSERSCGGQAGTLDSVEEMVDLMRAVITALAPTSDDNPSGRMILKEQVAAYVDAMKRAEERHEV